MSFRASIKPLTYGEYGKEPIYKALTSKHSITLNILKIDIQLHKI